MIELQQIATTIDIHFFDTIIHDDTKLEASSGEHKPIQLYDPNARSAEDYSNLTHELLEKFEMNVTRPEPLKIVGSK